MTFIQALTINAITSEFLSSISPGWVVMFLDSHHTVFTFLSWLDLLGVVLAFWISILKIFKSLQNYWHMLTDTTSFEKHVERSSGHTLSFYQNFVKCRFSNIFLKEFPTRYFVSSGSKIVQRLRRRKYDPVIIEMTIGLILCPSTALYRSFLKHCTLTNKPVWTIWRDLSKPPQRRQGPDPRPLWLLVGIP